jgi:DNA-binding response OmpR family regulator
VIAPVPIARRGPVVVPVWLRVPGHADIAEVGDEDLVGELRRRGYGVIRLGVELEVGGLVVPPRAGTVCWRGQRVEVSGREADVLRVLAGAWPRSVPVRSVAAAVWGDEDADADVRMYVRYLRRKMPGLIVTGPKGAGYALSLEDGRA